jgi:hypothetical protein
MKRLNDSAIFSKLINNTELINKMKLIVSRNGITLLTPKDLESSYSDINRRIKYSTKGPIMDKIAKGIIVPFRDVKTKTPTYLPTITGKGVNGDFNIYVNLERYMNSSGEIYPKTFFALLQCCLMSYEFAKKWDTYVNNLDFVKDASFIYSRMTTKVLDKTFALDLDTFNSDLLSFIFAKFFIVNMCGRADNDLNDNIAYKCCFNKSSLDLIKQEEESLSPNKYNSFFELIDALKEIKSIKSINVRSFIENFTRMFGEGSLLALDYLPSFIQCVTSAAIGGGLNKDYMYESVAGKIIQNLYLTITKLISY